MAFKFIGGVEAPVVSVLAATSTAFVEGSLVRFDATSGLLEPTVGSSPVVYGVCLETKTTGSGGGEYVSVQEMVPGAHFLADCSGTPTQAMTGDAVDTEGSSASPTQIDENSTTEGIFRIVKAAYTGVLADKKLVVEINPQATSYAWSA